MNRIHFRMDDDLLSQVENYMKNHNCTKTRALINLIEAGLEKNNIALDIQVIKKMLYKLISRTNYNRTLLEQLYSDLGKEM